MLRGRVNVNPQQGILGYMDGELLSYAQQIYESKEENTPLQIVLHVTPVLVRNLMSMRSLFHDSVSPPKPKRVDEKWDENRLRCIITQRRGGPLLETNIGRSFAKSHLNPKRKIKFQEINYILLLNKS